MINYEKFILARQEGHTQSVKHKDSLSLLKHL